MNTVTFSHGRGSHCSFCGAGFNELVYPRKCQICDSITYSNPLPVVCMLIPAYVGDDSGIVLIKRRIPPGIGEWALPGGYLEVGETWQQGAVREVSEEIGLKLNPTHVELFSLDTASNGNLLIFATYSQPIPWSEVEHVAMSNLPNEEVYSVDLCFLSTKLAFPSHTVALEKFLKK